MIKISHPNIDSKEIEAVSRVLRSGTLVRGQETRNFEDEFADFIGCEHAIATSNGTTALHVALAANDIGKGDEVLVPSFSFIASANSVLYTGAKPIFVDVAESDFNIAVDTLEDKITKNTKAIMAVHLYGQTCDMTKLKKICDSNDLILIEDACQAHGATYEGKYAGSFGTGCFSFYATKNMTTGEGGMITTNDASVAEKARMLINHGSSNPYDNKILGYNFRMTEMQAAMGLVQLRKLNQFNDMRIKNALDLTKLLRGVEGIKLPETMPGRKHVFHQYTIKTDNREEIIKRLEANVIGYGIYYPKPIHKQEFYMNMGYKDSLPVSEMLSQKVLSLPVHPKLTHGDITKIINLVSN